VKEILRIGAGAGFSGDRIEPAVELAEHGRLDVLVFECLAERTIALAQQARLADPEGGFDPLLERRLATVLPACAARGVRIISNMGAANPAAAARKAVEIAAGLGLRGLRIAAVTGDDVLDQLLAGEGPLAAARAEADAQGFEVVSANAYLGCEPVVEALARGADVIITGRVADPSLFLAPMVHAFGWAADDWLRLGRGTAVGHLLECAGQVTGGYFADPGLKDVPGLARLGFPLAEVAADGGAVITKLEGSGGAVTVAGCAEQLLYEVHDPQRYLTPDVTADFSQVALRQLGPDRVEVSGAAGAPRPDQLKASVGRREGFIGKGCIGYAGPGAVERAELAGMVVLERLRLTGVELLDVRLDLVGMNALGPLGRQPQPSEVQFRIAARTATLEAAQRVGLEVEALYTNGPAGGGGVVRSAAPVLAVADAFLPREAVRPRVHLETVP
jgi:hypothetical protein